MKRKGFLLLMVLAILLSTSFAFAEGTFAASGNLDLEGGVKSIMISVPTPSLNVKDGWDESKTHYYENGKTKTGFVSINGTTYFFDKKGEFKSLTGMVKDEQGNWKFVRNGKVDYNATGLVQSVQAGHKSKGSYYYVENGEFKKDATGMVKGIQPDSSVKGNWYFVLNGQYKGSGTGLVECIQAGHTSQGKYFYVENGVFVKNANGMVKGIQPNSSVKGNWYYVQDGQYKGNGTGLVECIQAGHKSQGKFFYVEKGVFQKDVSGMVKGIQPKSSVEGNWYYVVNGQFKGSGNGLVKCVQAGHKSEGNYFYVENGEFKKDATGIVKGIQPNSSIKGNWYYVRGGQFKSTETGLADCVQAGYQSKGKVYYVKNGAWQKSFTGVADAASDGRNYYIKNGTWLKTNTTASLNGSDYVIIEGIASKVSSESDRTLWRAMKVVENITDDSMSKEQKLRKCFDYVRTNYRESRPRTPHYTGTDWPIIYANDMFVRGNGNCCSYAAAFAYTAKAIGYTEVYACNSGGHGWAEVDGLVYDPEWSLHGPYIYTQYGPYDYYGTTYSPQRTDMNYRGAIATGYAYMRVKI